MSNHYSKTTNIVNYGKYDDNYILLYYIIMHSLRKSIRIFMTTLTLDYTNLSQKYAFLYRYPVIDFVST